jgi:hypothetical protein
LTRTRSLTSRRKRTLPSSNRDGEARLDPVNRRVRRHAHHERYAQEVVAAIVIAALATTANARAKTVRTGWLSP